MYLLGECVGFIIMMCRKLLLFIFCGCVIVCVMSGSVILIVWCVVFVLVKCDVFCCGGFCVVCVGFVWVEGLKLVSMFMEIFGLIGRKWMCVIYVWVCVVCE